MNFPYHFNGKPSVKDAIQAIGVPHTEVDLILVNGISVTFDQHLQPGDQISVYPVFETLDISDVTHLRPRPSVHRNLYWMFIWADWPDTSVWLDLTRFMKILLMTMKL